MKSEHYPQFVTATFVKWLPLLEKDEYKDVILESLKFMVSNNRIRLYAFVIMPNHIHLIWHVLLGHKPSDVQRDFLKYTSQRILQMLRNGSSPMYDQLIVNKTDRQRQVWQRDSMSVDLYSDHFLEQKLEYIHWNPCQDKWKLAILPEAYYYSSARFYELNIDDFGFLSHCDGE